LVYLLVFHTYINEMHGSRSKIPSQKSRPYIYDVKFLALLGAPYIYDISMLRVNLWKIEKRRGRSACFLTSFIFLFILCFLFCSILFSFLLFYHISTLTSVFMHCPIYCGRASISSFRSYHLHSSGWAVQIMKLLIMKFSPLPCYLVPLKPIYSPIFVKYIYSLYEKMCRQIPI
jgi:hypothetical protein